VYLKAVTIQEPSRVKPATGAKS